MAPGHPFLRRLLAAISARLALTGRGLALASKATRLFRNVKQIPGRCLLPAQDNHIHILHGKKSTSVRRQHEAGQALTGVFSDPFAYPNTFEQSFEFFGHMPKRSRNSTPNSSRQINDIPTPPASPTAYFAYYICFGGDCKTAVSGDKPQSFVVSLSRRRMTSSKPCIAITCDKSEYSSASPSAMAENGCLNTCAESSNVSFPCAPRRRNVSQDATYDDDFDLIFIKCQCSPSIPRTDPTATATPARTIQQKIVERLAHHRIDSDSVQRFPIAPITAFASSATVAALSIHSVSKRQIDSTVLASSAA